MEDEPSQRGKKRNQGKGGRAVSLYMERLRAAYNRAKDEFNDEDAGVIRVFCTVKTEGKTGVEMEALTGVQVALLTIYDMCKAIDKHMVMSDIHLEEKTGGKSGDFRFEEK